MSSGTRLHHIFQDRLSRRDVKGSKRRLTVTAPGAVDFSSNDFLSLSKSPLLRSEFLNQLQKAKKVPLGSGGSRLLDGNSHYVEQLESDIADFHDAAAGLLFNSGFDANSALFSCIPQPGDVVIYDEYIHASVHEGMRLSRAQACISFAHNNLKDFQRTLRRVIDEHPSLASGETNLFVAVETVYSMDGDVAPLKTIVDIVADGLPDGNGHIIVDEAHSTGVYGDHGRGLVHQLGLQDRILARLHTFGKALTSAGAIVLCSPVMREYLINYARSLIYTTALGLPSLAMIISTYRLMRRGATVQLQFRLWRLIQHFHKEVQSLPIYPDFQVSPNPPTSPIFSMRTTKPRDLASICQKQGFVVRPIVYPTVPKGAERVRVCLHAGNTEDEVDRLLRVVNDWLKSLESHSDTQLQLRARL